DRKFQAQQSLHSWPLSFKKDSKTKMANREAWCRAHYASELSFSGCTFWRFTELTDDLSCASSLRPSQTAYQTSPPVINAIQNIPSITFNIASDIFPPGMLLHLTCRSIFVFLSVI